MTLHILNIAHHRNGIGGAAFYAIVFRDQGKEGSVKLAVVFETEGHVAVFDIAKLAGCDVEFGSNSWRGDHYEPALRRAIKNHERQHEQQTPTRKEPQL